MEEIITNCKNLELDKFTFDSEKIEQINFLLSPENLENSKIISILNENLTVKINELYSLKEISKICSSITELIEIVRNFSYLKISQSNDSISYNLDENMITFSIINIPHEITRTELLSKLDLANVSNKRLFKKSLFWILTLNTTEVDKNQIENKIKNLNFEQTSKCSVKYDVITKRDLIKTFLKQIQTNSYQKESQSLKAVDMGKNSSKKGDREPTYNNNSINEKDRNNSDTFSWRKQSNADCIVTIQTDEKNFKGNELSYKNSMNRNNMRKDCNKRERFNSDGINNNNSLGFNQKFSTYNPISSNENSGGIEIDLDSVKYPMLIKHSYNFEKIAEFYYTYNKANLFETKPTFNIEVENLYSDLKKECRSLIKLKSRDRSNTFTHNSKSDNKYKSNYYERNNEDTNRNRNNSFYTNFDNSNSSLKIPMFNPLSNMQKNYNKFDDYDNFNSRLGAIRIDDNNYKYNKYN